MSVGQKVVQGVSHHVAIHADDLHWGTVGTGHKPNEDIPIKHFLQDVIYGD
jgi:hypothetical protein